MKLSQQQQIDILMKELAILQGRIDHYDESLFKIKSWAITIFSAFIIVSIKEGNPVFLAFCAIALLMFWSMEALFKKFQHILIKRCLDIEEYFESGDENEHFSTPRLASIYHENNSNIWKKVQETTRFFFFENVMLLYLSMFLILGAIAIWMA